jgi:L-aminopeptidase/D-esterase-like protein
MAQGWITEVAPIKVGHFTDPRRPTGCTVVLCEAGATAGVDVRGSAPGTRETDLLKPGNLVDQVNAILLAGGSAFGLDAASGVMRYLEENGSGFLTAYGRVPIVPAAILYDLATGDPKIRPDAEAGYKACLNAASGPVKEGSVGAGSGATVGKLAGGKRMKGGIGTSSIRLPNGLVVGALVAVNCAGDVMVNNEVSGVIQIYRSGFALTDNFLAGQNTTIGVVATNIVLSKTQLTKIAEMAHDGLARAINPAHTPFDGDTLFAISTGTSKVLAHHGVIGALAAEAVREAIIRAVVKANLGTERG